MNELSFQSIRTSYQAREADEVRTESRKRNLLILVLHYLFDQGYVESGQMLSKETNIDLSKFEACDNIDLETMLMEYEAYYYIKFQRYPKITKRLTSQSSDERARVLKGKGKAASGGLDSKRCNSTPALPRIPPSSTDNSVNLAPNIPVGRPGSSSSPAKRILTNKSTASSHIISANDPVVMNGDYSPQRSLAVQGATLRRAISQNTEHGDSDQRRARPGQIIDVRAMLNEATRIGSEYNETHEDRLLKPLGAYMGYNAEWRELAQVISRDIYVNNPNIRWDDIIGLETAKRLVKEAVVYPIKYPTLFKGILSPWKGLLLYGPPGTGKTLLAKAVATECNTTFFNISASSIVSKWRGDSEKLVRILFELARFHAPSTIFLDELESLMSQRGSQGQSGGEHEGSRRMKTELLVQMDGLAKSDDLVFLLAASNLPWELDHAMLRRLEKRILVDLPTPEARAAMFQHHLPPTVWNGDDGLSLISELNYEYLAQKTDGYSGSDIQLVCKEAAMRSVRKIFYQLENHTEGSLNIQLETIRTEDVLAALQHTKATARLLKQKYLDFQREYESV